MLFGCGFEGDLASLVVDAKDEAHARTIATEAAGVAPIKVVEIPAGIFVAELFVEDDDGIGTVIDPLEHVADYLEKLDLVLCGEDADDEDACGDEAETETDELVTCGLPPGHEGQHEGVSETGEAMLW